MSRFPRGERGRNVSSGALLCNGTCSLWYHSKCVNEGCRFKKKIQGENNGLEMYKL